ncbi:coiled-coil domain-containing protein 42-like isoform X1 [Columba livia]|uniref:coiled-coil domain-containing protein 42-like isoform X1 n=1 Tax=Columba livia TaxID=8932 RepID=UPI0031BB8DDA
MPSILFSRFLHPSFPHGGKLPDLHHFSLLSSLPSPPCSSLCPPLLCQRVPCWGCHAARRHLRWCWVALARHPTLDTVQHPAQAPDPTCNLDGNFCGRKHRLTEEGSLSPFVRLQEKRKEAKQVQKALEEKREAFKETMADIARRWRELHAKEDQLKTYMEKSMRRLKEDDKLRVQALKKAMREREQKTQKEMELVRAKKKLKALKKEHQKLSKQVQKYSIFKEYLEDVVKISPQFEDIQDVISRYKLLVRTRKDLQQSQEKDKEMIKQTKVLLDRYEAEKEAETLQYQNELEQLQQRFAQAQSDVRSWTARWADIQNRNVKNGLMLTTMKMAIHNLFQCVNTQLKAKVHVPKDDSLRQLDMIQQSILDLNDIVTEVKRRTWRATGEQLSTSIKGKRRTESPRDVVLRP